jgi:threonine/homoserine/homoserine lactone efflux protein
MQLEIFDAVWKGIFIGLFMALSVGPTLFAVIKYSMQNSYKAGLAFVLGVSVSDIMYVTMANFAVSWLSALSTYNKLIGFVGASILIVIGVVGLFRKIKPQRPGKTNIVISGSRYFRIWFSGWLINTINPGVIISWLAAVTATAGKSSGYRFVLFAVCLALILCIDFLKVGLAERIRRILTPRRIIYMQRIISGIVIFLGGALLYKTIFVK